MKKSFQLSAVAIAIAASSSVMADVQLSIDGTPLSATINAGTGVNVIAQNNVILQSGSVRNGDPISFPSVGTPNSTTTVPYDIVQTRDETQQQTSQVYTPEKLEFTSMNKEGVSKLTTSYTADVSYNADGEYSGSGNIIQTNNPNWEFDNATATTLSEESITLGKKTTGAENALTITKIDANGSATTEVTASGITTGTLTANTIIVSGTDVKATLDQHRAAIDQEVIDRTNEVARLDGRVDQEVIDRTNEVARLDSRVDQEVIDRTNEVARLDGRVDQEVIDREIGDQAIRNDIATKVTTNSLEVNGPSNFNGPVTVNNVKATTTVDQAGTPATTPEFGADVNGDGRPDTLIQKKEQTDTVTVQSQTQAYNENNLTFTAKTEKGTLTTTNQYTADIIYDQNGVATYGPNASNGQTVTPDLQTVAEDSIIVGKETANSETALTVRSKDATGESVTTVTSKSVATGNITAKAITLDGQDLATTIANGDAATLTSAKGYTDTTATTLRSEAAAETVRVNKAIVDGDAATLASAKGYTDTTATTLRSEAAAETVRVNKAIVDGDAATLTSANGYTDTKAAATLTSANGYTDTKAAATLTSANGYTDTKAAATLASANAYTDGRANQLNTRIDDVQRTAYRGIAISLAAQQAVPSIGPGQVAIFGGVGHYEGETAGSIGVVTAFTDRLSASGAFGFAGGNEFGGRVGVAYVFGGK